LRAFIYFNNIYFSLKGRFSGGHQSKTYKWRNPIEEAVCSMRTIPSSDNYHIGIEIPNDGFYYVYTQVTNVFKCL